MTRPAVLLAVLCTTAAAATDYTGSAACGACHPAEYAAWTGSRHELALRPAHAGTAAIAFDGRSRTFPSLTLRPLRSAARLAFDLDAPPSRIPLNYVLGVSEVEQYLTPVGRGRWQALPVGFDPERREWFDVFPEAPAPNDWAHWTNPGATANSQCLECHTTGFVKGFDASTDAYTTTWAERGVGCEACHGPGAGHAAAHRAGHEPPPYGALAEAPPMPGCVFCHSRRAMVVDPYDPAGSIADQMDLELLDSGLYHPDGQLRGEAYAWVSFQMSRMAAEGVGCQDCHEPHAGTLREDGNALCMRCHEAAFDTEAHTHHPAGSAGSACVACHMPEVTFMERDPRRDHLLGRPDPTLAATIGAPDACTACHTDRTQAWAGAAVEQWFPVSPRRDRLRQHAATFAAARDGHAESAPFLGAIATDPSVDAVRRASAARLLGQFTGQPGVATALLRTSADDDPLVRAGAARSLGEVGLARDDVRARLVRLADDPARTVRLETAFGLRAIDLAALPAADRAAVSRALDELLASYAMLAELPEANFNRGLVLAARGDAPGAEAAYRAAVARWPHDLPPRQNLALLLVEQGRSGEAAGELDALLARRPGWPPAAFARALLHAERKEWADAAALLEACLAGDAAYPRAAYNLGLAYAKLGDPARAATALERATQDPAARREALRERVRLAHLQGDDAAERRWLPEALLADPGVRDDPRVRAALGATPEAPGRAPAE